MKTALFLTISLACAPVLLSQTSHEFYSLNGTDSSVDSVLDGWTVADHYGGSNYQGYVGEMGLIFEDQASFSAVTDTPEGTFRGDLNDTYADDLGLRVFCIDSETGFVGAGTSSVQTYRPYTLSAAEQRYTDEGVSGYTAGGLKRAAYLLEQNFAAIVSGGDLESATMQSVIWEVLTDTNVSLTTGQGNYYLRNNTFDSTLNQRADDVISLGNTWLAAAEADNWGGASYNPEGGAIFWLDPDSVFENQSVISLALPSLNITPVPEPSSALLVTLGSLFLFRRKRPL